LQVVGRFEKWQCKRDSLCKAFESAFAKGPQPL